MGITRLYKYYSLRVRRLRGSPRDLAGGIAIGIFIGLTPTIPFHTGLILIFAFITRTSFIAGVISSWIVCNPLTTPFVYYIATVIGNHISPYTIDPAMVHRFLEHLHDATGFHDTLKFIARIGYKTTTVLLVGGFSFSTPIAILSYWPLYRFFQKLQQKRKNAKILTSRPNQQKSTNAD